jgi:MFS family permease
VLQAQAVGLSLTLVPIVMVVMNVAYAASAYPVGALSDRSDRATVLMLGLLLLLMADVVLAFATDIFALGFGVILWGLHMGFTQGLLATLVADAAPAELRGTAYGMFNLVAGGMMLLASVIAGALWDVVGPRGTFLAGGAFTVLTLLGLLPVRHRLDGRDIRS